MVYISCSFYFFIVILLVLYYIVPLRFRWWILLAGSLCFFCKIDPKGFGVFLSTALASYLMGLLLGNSRYFPATRNLDPVKDYRYKLCLFLSIAIVAIPLLVTKNANFVLDQIHKPRYENWIIPLGISFYTLQMISYLVDVYNKKIEPQKNPFKYLLFVSFFPQIVQGPIPRYDQLKVQLFEGHRFHEKNFVKGLHLIIWGFFLKFMLADRAGIVVNAVFDNFPAYRGGYVFYAGILYSIQLYTDFLACVVLSQGTAALFGIELQDNFRHPYKARSIKEFWRRWHITLSSWLRDYIYIPLGGNRKGKLLRYINLGITFFVSGLWHGTGYKYVFWGLLHAFYQIVGEITAPVKNCFYNRVKIPKDSGLQKAIQTIGTFFWVMLAWIIFRADSLKTGIVMIKSMFITYNPWIFFDDSLFNLGLSWKESFVLLLSVGILFFVEKKQEAGSIRDWILEQNIVVRWTIYLAAICGIVILGAYGYGFNSQDFIYGGF